MSSEWEYVLNELNKNLQPNQRKFTMRNTPKSLYDFWVEKKRLSDIIYKNKK